SNRGYEDRHWYAQLTRFLPAEVRGHFTPGTRTPDEAPPERAAGVAAEAAPGVDVLLAGLWSDA
ncbi:MAG TPA: hypothetical protein VF129_06090, partial [Actinomycetota bacterium]